MYLIKNKISKYILYFTFFFIVLFPINAKALDFETFTSGFHQDTFNRLSNADLNYLQVLITRLYIGDIVNPNNNNPFQFKYVFYTTSNNLYLCSSWNNYQFSGTIMSINANCVARYTYIPGSYSASFSIASNTTFALQFYDTNGLNLTMLLWGDDTTKIYSTNQSERAILSQSQDTLLKQSFPYGGNWITSYTDPFQSLLYRKFGYYLSSLGPIDTTPPVITLVGPLIIYHEIPELFYDPGYSCVDDTDLICTVIVTSNLNISVLGTYIITYAATDSSGNKSVKTRVVHVVDTTPPFLELIGDNPLLLPQYSEYFEYGAEYWDNSGESLTLIIDDSELDTSIPNIYSVHYSVCDSSNNCSSLIRKVHVLDSSIINTFSSQYLPFSFDDIITLFPGVNLISFSPAEQFIITLLFNIFFIIFLIFIIYIFLKLAYKLLDILRY